MLADELKEIIEPVAAALELDLWGIEASLSGKRGVVRVFVQSAAGRGEPDTAATIDQCAELSRKIGLVLDVEDIIPGAYTLEVSSPGMERHFFSLDQLKPYLNRTVEAETTETVALEFPDRKRFRGTLKAVRDTEVELIVDSERITIPWNKIKKARLRPTYPDQVNRAKGSPSKGSKSAASEKQGKK